MFSSFLPYLTKDLSEKKPSVITKTGDGGTTSLWNGEKCNKFHPHICLIGQLDSLNSQLGMAKSLWKEERTKQNWSLYNAPGAGATWYRHNPCIESGMYYEWFIFNDIISEVQRLIMDMSSLIASPPTTTSIVRRIYEKEETPQLFIKEEALENIEILCRRIDSLCPKITEFTVPGGGGTLSAWLDVIRTTTRDCERHYVKFFDGILPFYQKNTKDIAYPQYYGKWVENNRLCLKIVNRLSDFFFILKRFITMTLDEVEDLYKISKKQK